MKTIPLLLALIIAAAPATAEIYKCKTAAGGTVYQAEPCPGGAKTGIKTATRAQAQDPAPVVSHAARDLAQANKFETERLARETERQIEHQEAIAEEAQQSMTEELAALQAKQSRAKNNLAGATWLQSIAQEMQAVTAKHQTTISEARAKIATLKAAALGSR